MSFHDHFSHDSRSYRAGRPSYPPELFAWLASVSPTRKRAWDCACGNGQASVPLALYFDEVIATDASEAQLREAVAARGVSYRLGKAEESGLEDGSVDLVTVAQAAHWFDHEAFHKEVRRVLKPGEVIALWSYGLHSIDPEVDRIVLHFYKDIIGRYWPPERAHVDNAYRDLPFPFPRIDTPTFEMTADWTIDQMLAYLNTWSSVKEYRKANGSDPLDQIASDLSFAWGDVPHPVTWPLAVLAGRRDG